MKLIIVMMTTCLMQVTAATFAQKLTYSKKGASLEEIFKEIKKQTGYNVLYSPEKVDDTKKIDVYFKETALPEVLEKVVSGQALEYTINDKNISLKPKEPTFLERLANRWASIDASGRVVDSENRPLPGASVKVKKTGKGVSTDKDGKFFLRGVEEGAVLVVSFIGYLPKEVNASTNMGNVVLEQSLSKLDEVQVIAYGTTTQRLSTGNVTTIKADVIEKQPVNNPLLALQGRVPGLFIEQATGFAGTGVKVRIQGQNSDGNLSGNDPLYVIDGIPFSSQLLPGDNPIVGSSGGSGDRRSSAGNPMSYINPADIESIDVLKDADATAIYGSRAANGAILITTKKGKAGDTRVNLNLQSGWGKVSRKLNLMNSQQYLEMRREALRNDGIITPATGPYGDNDLNGNWDINRNTDWQKELIGRTAGYQDLNASVSGGNDKTVFFVGAGHHRETTVFPGKYSDNKTSVRFNISNTSNNQKLKIILSGSYLLDNNRLPQYDITPSAMTLAPVSPPLNKPDGGINWAPTSTGASTFLSNPIGQLSTSFLNKTTNLISNMTLSYQIIPGLELKSDFNYNKLNTDIISKSFLESNAPEFIQYNTRSTLFKNNDINSWSIEPQVNYRREIGKGQLNILIGATVHKNTSIGSSILAYGFSNDLVMEDILSATKVVAYSSISSVYKYTAGFGRINFNWQDKYIMNLTGRRDGSSRFGPKSQYHNFGAIAGAWVFSNEKLVKNYLTFLSFGKIRTSYGVTGSDQISDYQFLSLYSPFQQHNPYQGIVAYQLDRLTNPYLEWEETKKLQFGLDLGFLKDRILLNTNYYVNRSSNHLGGYILPATAGFLTIPRNIDDEIKNSGWEFVASITNLITRNFKWSSSVNITIPKTLLKSSSDARFFAQSIVGQPLTAVPVYHFLGVDPATGIYQFEDRNGNPTSTPNDPLDRTILIDLAPKFYGGFQNSFSYKSFQLDIFFSYVKQIALNNAFGVFSAGYFNGGTNNQITSLMDRWQKPGDISTVQKFTTGFELDQYLTHVKNSDAAWSDASYIRLKNVSLSWQLPEQWTKVAHLQVCNLYIQGQNLFTLTNYNGLDPETKSSSTLPPLRVITIGLKVGL